MSKSSSRTRRAKVDYQERQVAHLCGKHALNHVLQEEKVVWVPNKPFLLATVGGKAAPAGALPTDEAVKLNMWAFCKERGLAHLRAQRAEYLNDEAGRISRQLAAGEPSLKDPYYQNPKCVADLPKDILMWKKEQAKYGGKSIEEIVAMLDKSFGKDESLKQLEEGGIGCTMSGSERGDIPYTWFRELFDMLGLTYIEVDDLNFMKVLRSNFDTPGYIGMVINQGQWHYVAVPKYVSACPSRKHALADSLDSGVFECHTKRGLYKALETLPLSRAFLLFAKDGNAYQSVAVKRMLKKVGRKRKTLKMV